MFCVQTVGANQCDELVAVARVAHVAVNHRRFVQVPLLTRRVRTDRKLLLFCETFPLSEDALPTYVHKMPEVTARATVNGARAKMRADWAGAGRCRMGVCESL